MTRRYPWAPLAAAMGMASSSAAHLLGVGGSTWTDYRERGLTPRVADRLAVKAGFHPSEVWPSWAQDAEEDRLAADEAARERKRARDRRYQQRRRQDPAARARNVDYLRGYRATYASQLNAERNRRYWANRAAELERQHRYDATVRAARRRSAA